MSQPLKDIVAELVDGPLFPLNTLEERSAIISAYEKSMDFLLKLMENYVQEVNYTIEQRQSVSIVSRATQNLIYHIAYTHNLMWKYSTAIAVYLLDERYDKNNSYWKNFEERSDKIIDLIEKLKNNIVFNLSENIQIDKDLIFQDKTIIKGLGGSIPERVENENELAHASILKLLTCLEYMLNVVCGGLTDIKLWSITHYDDGDLENNYALNYALYAKEYWPKQVDNFRLHIANQQLRNNVTIVGLEKTRTDIIYEFEYHTDTGKIWRNYSEDYPQLVKELMRLSMDENQWEQYFKTLLEIDELDRWIEELRNPPEAKKKAAVLTKNKLFMAVMAKAVEQGLCTQSDWQYKWANRGDGAYFASVASHKFELSRRHDRDGDLAISWKPFEALFDEKNLRSVFNDWQNGRYSHKNKKKIDKLLR